MYNQLKLKVMFKDSVIYKNLSQGKNHPVLDVRDTSTFKRTEDQFPVLILSYDLMDVCPEETETTHYEIYKSYHDDYLEDKGLMLFYCPTRKSFYELMANLCKAIQTELRDEDDIYEPGDDATGDISEATELLSAMSQYDQV